MNYLLKHIIFVIVFIFNADLVFGQKVDFEKPPSQENTYLFKVLKYHRQPEPPEYIQNHISQIGKRPMSQWSAQDSLYYAYENVHLKNFDLALSIFTRLNTDTIQEPHAQTLYRTTLQHLERFEMLKEYNERTIPDDSNVFYSIKDAVLDLNKAYLKYKMKTFIPDSTLIFPILKDDTLELINLKKSPNKNKLVTIAFAIDSAFRHFTVLHDGKDYILSQAFEEMADFQKEYFYLTNALFYYSGSRHYNALDKTVIKKYNNVFMEMDKYNYISISFKNTFGKVIKNRFRMNTNFKENPDMDSSLNSSYTPPPKKEGRKDHLPWIDNSILIMIILGLALFFVLFFMKAKK